MSDPIADAYVQWATAQKPVQPPQEIRVSHDCVMAMTKAWQQYPTYCSYARAAWPHLFHAWMDGLTEDDRAQFWSTNFRGSPLFATGESLIAHRAALRAIGPADPRREGV